MRHDDTGCSASSALGHDRDVHGGVRPEAPILVVEDEADLRQLISGLLRADGYATVTATNGSEALRLLREEGVQPCLILLDLLMPVMNGWTFLRRAREDRRLARVPVIVVTGYLPCADAARLGAADVLSKPFDLDRLLEVVGAHCASDADVIPPAAARQQR